MLKLTFFNKIYKEYNIFKLALLNVIRRKNQSILTIVLSALTIFTLVLVIGVYGHIQKGITLSNDRVGADVIIMASSNDIDKGQVLYTAEPTRKYIKVSDLEFLNNFDDEIQEKTYQFFSQTLSGGCCSLDAKLRVVGFDQETDFLLKPWMQQKGINKLEDNQVIIGQAMYSLLGRDMRILGQKFTPMGSLYQTGTGLDRTIFMDINVARKITDDKMGKVLRVFRENDMKDLVSSVFIKLDPSVNIGTFVNKVNSMQDNVKAVAKSTAMDYFKDQLRGWTLIVLFLIIALCINVSVALYGRFNALARERRSEIGYLRAMGLKKTSILKLIISEAWIMSLIGGLCGSFISLIFLPSTIKLLEKMFVLPSGYINILSIIVYLALGLLAALVLGTLASLFPALKAMRMEPQKAMSKGGLE